MTMAEFTRGRGWVLVLSWVSILHSIMLNIDCVYDMHFVLQRRDETSVASINQWVTRSDSKNMVVS